MIKHANPRCSYGCDKANEENSVGIVSESEVTCKDCLKVMITNWQRQVDTFDGQPQINAIEGLKVAKARLEEVEANLK